ncbi:hypothetical protein TCAL_14231 [Tigriopus californicus]|uniref:BTB domain-containing protein n=1 Tax=Tigriopus californicus TaxID=6832 RepID=A0A553NUW4_TIGCA|nr:hypothetical protein TCAL_14231 [Tigriopus californicus]
MEFHFPSVLAFSPVRGSFSDLKIQCQIQPIAGRQAQKGQSASSSQSEPQSKVFEVHRLILAAGSGYFRRHLIPRDSSQSPLELELLGIKPRIFQHILDLLYDGRTSLATRRDVCYFAHTARHLELNVYQDIEEKCLDELPLLLYGKHEKTKRQDHKSPAGANTNAGDQKVDDANESDGSEHLSDDSGASSELSDSKYLHELWKKYAADPKCHDRKEPSSRLRPKIKVELRGSRGNMWKCAKCVFSSSNKAKLERHVARRHDITYKI